MSQVTYSFPRKSELQAPDACALCGGAAPEKPFRFASYPKKALGQVMYLFGVGPHLELKLHDRCRTRVWWRETLRRAAVVAVIAFPFAAHFAGMGDAATTAITVIVGLPILFWQIFWSPKPVDLCCDDRHMEVRFRNPRFAVEFAELNRPSLIWQAGKKPLTKPSSPSSPSSSH